MNEEIQAGQVVPFDDYSDVKILAIADGWVMIQRVHTALRLMPMVMSVHDLHAQMDAVMEVRWDAQAKDGEHGD